MNINIQSASSFRFVAAILAAYFIYSATSEERFLAKQFPDTFPPYKARTKMLIPFVI